jgi:transcriptional/translational regulatory protein YebC/TACO1
MFEAKGQIAAAGDTPEDKIMEAAINAGAEDVAAPEGDGGVWAVTTAPGDFQVVKDGLETAGIQIEEAQLAMVPTTRVSVAGESAQKLIQLVDAIEDLDDVQKVYTNSDIADEELARLQA